MDQLGVAPGELDDDGALPSVVIGSRPGEAALMGSAGRPGRKVQAPRT